MVDEINGGIEDTGAKLTLLGTMGGSRMTKERGAPSQVIVINGRLYVIDCGSGVGRQLAFAGHNLKDLKCLFITHHHNDHNLDYGTLLSLAQTEGVEESVDVFGPPPMGEMVRLFMEWHDHTERRSPFPFTPVADFTTVHEFVDGGAVMEDEYVKVSCARVIHPPCEISFAYRFDTVGRSITISGDTAPSEELVKLAAGSDVLVHEVYYEPFIEMLSARLPRYKGLAEWFPTAHTTARDAGRIARDAGVETLVLTHLVPGDRPVVADEVWMEEAGRFFQGEVIVGRDLLVI